MLVFWRSSSNQIFIFLKQLLENNTKQTDNFFGLTCPVLSWLSTRVNDLKFRKKKGKLQATQKSGKNRPQIHFKSVCWEVLPAFENNFKHGVKNNIANLGRFKQLFLKLPHCYCKLCVFLLKEEKLNPIQSKLFWRRSVQRGADFAPPPSIIFLVLIRTWWNFQQLIIGAGSIFWL